jgi:hypothetical protein
MANTFNLGNGNWAQKTEKLLAYNAENDNYKPLPFDFDRASTATVVNKDGLIETVGVDEPRIDFLNNTKGHLLLEPQRTNIFDYSSDLSAWSKLNSTVSESSVLSLDGVNNSYGYERTSSSTSYIYRTVSLANTTQYTLSFFVKSGTSTNVRTDIWDTTQSVQCQIQVDLETKAISNFVGTSYKIEDYTNGWIRISVTFTSESSLGTTFNRYFNADSVGSELYIWGAQTEAGSYATSYIPTSGSAVTRSAETCYQDNLLTDIINASYPFTMYAEAKAVIDDSQHFLTFSNRSLSNTYFTLVLNSDGTVKLDARVNGISEFLNSSATAITNGDFFKTAITMESATSGKICVNGVLDSKTNFTQQAINTNINDLLVGMLRTVSDTGRRIPIKDVKLYNTALTDAELIALTS